MLYLNLRSPSPATVRSYDLHVQMLYLNSLPLGFSALSTNNLHIQL